MTASALGYACASAASVSDQRCNGLVVVEVTGVGGADAANGSGLRGLADRRGARFPPVVREPGRPRQAAA
jgi:hypothetical protein